MGIELLFKEENKKVELESDFVLKEHTLKKIDYSELEQDYIIYQGLKKAYQTENPNKKGLERLCHRLSQDLILLTEKELQIHSKDYKLIFNKDYVLVYDLNSNKIAIYDLSRRKKLKKINY